MCIQMLISRKWLLNKFIIALSYWSRILYKSQFGLKPHRFLKPVRFDLNGGLNYQKVLVEINRPGRYSKTARSFFFPKNLQEKYFRKILLIQNRSRLSEVKILQAEIGSVKGIGSENIITPSRNFRIKGK